MSEAVGLDRTGGESERLKRRGLENRGYESLLSE